MASGANHLACEHCVLPNATPGTAARTRNVCGHVPAGQNVPAGNYADTLVATVNS